MTEPPCSNCGCEAHWHRYYGQGPTSQMTMEWNPKDGRRGHCAAFTTINKNGFRERCKCRSYRMAKVRVTA